MHECEINRMDNAQNKIYKYIYDRLSHIYCNTCRNDLDDDMCDYCHRKNMNWAISEEEAHKIAEKITEIIKVGETNPSAQPEQRWIPVTERLPENDNEVLITVWDAEDDYVEVYKGFYQDHEWWTQWCHGCLKIKDEPCGENIVIAWMPLPEPYKKGEANG